MTSHTEYETLLFGIENNVGRITLNRPKAANALNMTMGKELLQVVMRCDEEPNVRAVLITGSGKLFCGGGDLVEFTSQDNLPAHIKELTVYLHAAISRLARMDAPVIAAVNGTAGGAGFSIACACDIIYVAERAKLTLAYTAAGLTPDGSSTYFLPRLVGLRRAMELAITNRRLTAQEALEWGLVNRVLPKEELLKEATALAEKLAQGPTKAYGSAKRLLQGSFNESLETQMENEAQAIANIARTADAKEGASAFLQKRRPTFRGA